MRPTPALRTNGHTRANGAERRTDRELEPYLHLSRQLRSRYRRSLSALSVRAIAKVLIRLENQNRIDIATLRSELDGRDMREVLRLLSGDDRLGASLRG
jgi:hypothetical protein